MVEINRNDELAQTHETPLCRVAFRVPALVTGLPANYGRWLFPPRLLQTPPTGCHFNGGCSCRVSAVLRAGRIFSSSRYITGTLLIAIRLPFVRVFIFRELRVDP